MAIRSATQLGVGRDDDRWSPGFTKQAADVMFGGLVVSQLNTDATGKTLALFNGNAALGTTNVMPLGLVYEPTNPFQAVASGDNAAGGNFDSLDYARGNEYSVFHRPGNLVDVYDDGRDTTQVARSKNNGGGTNTQNTSAPFIVSDAFVIGSKLYATAVGLLTVTTLASGATAQIGYVRAVSGSGADLVLSVELAIIPVTI